MIKNHSLMSFSDVYVQKRTAKNLFYKHINTIVDWQSVENEINKHYTVGKSAIGNQSYSGLLLFKMLLIGVWNGSLSDRLVEEMLNENLSAMNFCGLRLEDQVPDHTRLSRFRTLLTEKRAFEPIMNLINDQLNNHGIIVKNGLKIDATITDSPRKPKKKTTFELAEDRKEDEITKEQVDLQTVELKLVKKIEPGVDIEARWIKKAGKTHYGFKKHIGTDENGLVLSVITTAANQHDSIPFDSLIEKAKLPEKANIYADKAYKSKKHDQLLKDKKLKNRIHHKATKGKPLTDWQLKFNKQVSKFRYTVERTFGSNIRWFKAGFAKYVGTAKTHTQHILESIAYNLKRSPILIVKLQMSQKLKVKNV